MLLNVLRVPIALRLFLTVLLTTLLIATASLSVLHWTMQKNFAKYVADVEMQKLDRLMTNLGNVYNVYHDWGNAIQAQILQIEGTAAPDDYDRLSQWWLRRQYDIAIQQHSFDEHTLINVSPDGASPNKNSILKKEIDDDTMRIVTSWNNVTGQYILFDENRDLRHDVMNIKSYTQITSPIRRIVDLLNLFEMQQIHDLFTFSKEARQFYNKWTSEDHILFINTNMKSIRKLQNECTLLDMFNNIPEIIEKTFNGIIIDIKNNTDSNKPPVHMVYVPELKITCKITKQTTKNYEMYDQIKCKLYMFPDEYNIKQKIRLEEVGNI